MEICDLRHFIVVSVRVSSSSAEWREVILLLSGCIWAMQNLPVLLWLRATLWNLHLKYLGNSEGNCLSKILLKIAIGNTTKCFGVYRAHQCFLNQHSALRDTLRLICTKPLGGMNPLGSMGSLKVPWFMPGGVCPSASAVSTVALFSLLIPDVATELCKCLWENWREEWWDCWGDLRMGLLLCCTITFTTSTC